MTQNHHISKTATSFFRRKVVRCEADLFVPTIEKVQLEYRNVLIPTIVSNHHNLDGRV